MFWYNKLMELKDTTLLAVLKKAQEKESPPDEKRAVATFVDMDELRRREEACWEGCDEP